MGEKIAIIGLGYVGLPVAVAFAGKFGGTVGFDISERRIADLRDGIDRTGEIDADRLRAADLAFTSESGDLSGCSFFVITVPTPIDANRQPDLGPLKRACETIAPALKPGAMVVLESTVYPGVTEEVCRPILERLSGLAYPGDFQLGYSPERINPGDREHRLETIVKVVAGDSEAATKRISEAYGAIIDAGLHIAPSIRVAEAAKVIENTQRDLNIALMNELAMIFDRLDIRTRDVLAAAGTKWNFLRFTPGLVGGHCIGVDPYYLTAKAEAVGYNPQIILSGRRINDGMGAFVAQRLVKLLAGNDRPVRAARVGVFGVTFKENVPDLRNSKVVDILAELAQFGIEPMVHEPLASAEDIQNEHGIAVATLDDLVDLDAIVLAVPHRCYIEAQTEMIFERLRAGGILVDVRAALDPARVPDHIAYWCL